MIKLLLLAILGLALGGGVWKAQNPEGTLDDLKAHATASVERLKSGVDAVIEHPDTSSDQASLTQRLEAVEAQIFDGDEGTDSAELQSMLDEKLAGNADSLSELQASLNERVAPMEDMTKAVAELDTALQDTRARADAGNVRLDAIDRRLELLVRRLDEQTTDTDLQAINQTLDGVQGSIVNLQDELDNRRIVVGETLAGLSEKSDTLSARLNTFVSSTTDATDQANAEATPSQQTNDESLTALSAGVDERLSSIEEKLATVNTDSRRIATLTQQLEDAKEKISQLEQTDAEATQSLSELNSSVESLTTAGESLSIENIQAQIRDELALAQSQFDSSASTDNTGQLEALIETTRGRIQTLEQRVQELPASSAEADGALETQSALQSQIADLELRLESLTSTDPALESTVNDVKEQVEQLSAKGFVTQDELRAQEEPESIEYKIYFDRNSADVTEDAAKVLNSFITQEKNRTTGVSIFGFTDRSGSAAYNQQLALQRATNVRSYLIQNGLDFTKIKALSGLGEDAAAAVLPDDSADAQQRVVVIYAAQP